MDTLSLSLSLSLSHTHTHTHAHQGHRNQSGWSGQNQTTFSALAWVMVIYYVDRMCNQMIVQTNSTSTDFPMLLASFGPNSKVFKGILKLISGGTVALGNYEASHLSLSLSLSLSLTWPSRGQLLQHMTARAGVYLEL